MGRIPDAVHDHTRHFTRRPLVVFIQPGPRFDFSSLYFEGDKYYNVATIGFKFFTHKDLVTSESGFLSEDIYTTARNSPHTWYVLKSSALCT